ncbi:MAG: hypothetical protein GDA67_12975 [Nitrospira sp. CR1.3]|nr:hypothetical protein [Nitrospira sp. CR1.3]
MMRLWMCSVMAMLLVGCVSSEEHERIRTQYEHLKDVKTEWETEKDDLQQRVDAVHRAYSNVSKEQGTLRLQQDQTKIEVARARDDARLVTGKLASQESRVAALDEKFGKVLDQLSLLAETNVTLTNRVESLITKMGAMMVRMKPVASRDPKARAPELCKEAGVKDEEVRPDDALRERVSKAGPNTPVPSKSGEETKKTENTASPAVEQAMRQLGVKADPSFVGRGAGKSGAPVKTGPITPASKIPQGLADGKGQRSTAETNGNAVRDEQIEKGEQERKAAAQAVVGPKEGTAAKGKSTPTDGSGSRIGPPAEPLAAPPPGTLTFSPQPAADTTVPEKGEKNGDGKAR